MIAGVTNIGDHYVPLRADVGYVMPISLRQDAIALQVVAAVDGFGLTHTGSQLVHGVVYGPDGSLLAITDEVAILYGAGLSWLSLSLETMILPAGSGYHVGIHAGEPLDGVARISARGSAARGSTYDDDYTDGSATSLPTLTAAPNFTLWLNYSLPYTLPSNVTDDWIAALPFSLAQSQLQVGVGAASSSTARVGWHGTLTDPNLGSLAIVSATGPFAGAIGERLRVTYGDRSVCVYAHTDGDILEDLSLTRRAFMSLAPAATTELTATVEILEDAS